MKAPGHVTTIAIATLATVVLATVAFALTAPSATGPDDAELPVIVTGVARSVAEDGTGSNSVDASAVPAPVLTDDGIHADDDADDGHETVVPKVRVEHDDDDDHDDAEPSEHAGDGESSEQHDEADDTHE